MKDHDTFLLFKLMKDSLRLSSLYVYTPRDLVITCIIICMNAAHG